MDKTKDAARPPFGYHPAYGLTDDYRLEALRHAEIHGVAAAATRYRVSQSTIYKWAAALRKDDTRLSAWMLWAMEGVTK